MTPEQRARIVLNLADGGGRFYANDVRALLAAHDALQAQVAAMQGERDPALITPHPYTPDHNGECLLCDETADAHPTPPQP